MSSYTTGKTKHRWDTDERSANPTPVCRRGHCGEVAVDGEWCAKHQQDVQVAQQHAAAVLASTRTRGRPRPLAPETAPEATP